jgi:hypothetical protein
MSAPIEVIGWFASSGGPGRAPTNNELSGSLRIVHNPPLGGAPRSLSAIYSGPEAIEYQWFYTDENNRLTRIPGGAGINPVIYPRRTGWYAVIVVAIDGSAYTGATTYIDWELNPVIDPSAGSPSLHVNPPSVPAIKQSEPNLPAPQPPPQPRPNPPPTVSIAITGTPRINQILTADFAFRGAATPSDIQYQWYKNGEPIFSSNDTLPAGFNNEPGVYTVSVTGTYVDPITGTTFFNPRTSPPFEVFSTITFNTGAGSPVPDLEVKRNTNAVPPTPPTNADPWTRGNFRGWVTNPANYNDFFNFANTPITGDVTLHAEWGYRPGDGRAGGGVIFFRDEAGFNLVGDLATYYYFEALGTNITPVNWSSSGTIDIPGAANPIRGAGKSNTNAIIAGDTGANFISLANLISPYVFLGWFVPSRDELNTLATFAATNNAFRGTFLSGFYWASSQADAANAHTQVFQPSIEGPGQQAKSGSGNIRLVRAF